MKAIFEPRSIAFIGASSDLFKWGFNILHHIVERGYAGEIHPVNPNGGTWFGRKIYTDVGEIPTPVDLAIIVVKDSLVLETVRKCTAKGIRAGIVITAGFSETGAAGAALEQEIVETALRGGMRIVGPNTMGVFSAYPCILHALMGSMPLTAGNVGLIVQSGNLGSSISYRFLRRKIGISRLVSSGNEADLTLEDFLEYLEHDPHTHVICLYVEGLRQGERFFRLARRIAKTKPIVLIKGGRTEKGAQAALSHTGAMASNDGVFSALCRQAGIIQVDTMDEMIDVAGMLLSQPLPAGNRVGILTMGGGWGVIATDLCIREGLLVEPLGEAVIRKLDRVLPPYWSRGNPIDLVAPGNTRTVTDAVRVLLEHASLDAVLVMGLGYMFLRARRWLMSEVVPKEAAQGPAEYLMKAELEVFGLIADLIGEFGRPIVPVVDIMAFDIPGQRGPLACLESRGIPAYPSPEPAVRALARVAAYAKSVREDVPEKRDMIQAGAELLRP
jgi:acyl-CoA synthetase (NDP forming)